MGIDIKINADLLFECSLKFLLESFYELTNPVVAFVVLLAVADENVIVISFNNA